ncbi:MAG: hypothetical protein PVF17_12010 [Ignavibacteria bacterium]|jgi:hypothetical protein
MRKAIHYLIIIVLAFTFGCDTTNEEKNEQQEKTPQIPNQLPEQELQIIKVFTPEQAEIRDIVTEVIYRNLEATQAEEVDGVLETIHSESPQFKSTKTGMEFVFKNYDMVYELEYLRFLVINSEEVQALYQQSTKATSGVGFANTRSVGIHTLKIDIDGKWKIFSTEVISSQKLL